MDLQGEWHQYDDMIHLELKKRFWLWDSTKEVVMKGRDLAGRVMLNIIFDLLTTWNEPNVDNFFFLLQQFFHTYSNPLLHDGITRQWGLRYGIEEVNLWDFNTWDKLNWLNSFQDKLLSDLFLPPSFTFSRWKSCSNMLWRKTSIPESRKKIQNPSYHLWTQELLVCLFTTSIWKTMWRINFLVYVNFFACPTSHNTNSSLFGKTLQPL